MKVDGKFRKVEAAAPAAFSKIMGADGAGPRRARWRLGDRVGGNPPLISPGKRRVFDDRVSVLFDEC